MSDCLERLAGGVDVDGREILGEREVSELALHLPAALTHHHHPKGLGAAEVERELQRGEDELLPGAVQLRALLYAARLHQVVAESSKPSITKQSSQ